MEFIYYVLNKCETKLFGYRLWLEKEENNQLER